MWLKIREVENLVTIKREHRAAPGSQLPNVTLCGRDKDGNDLTNELSWMVLEVMAQIHLSEPAVYVRYHEDQDESFIIHALKCNREFGGGNPAFLNDELGTQRYLDRGVPIEDACNWSASGCLGYHLECCEHMAGAVNLVQAKVMEVTLHDGFDPRTGKQVGLHTGDPQELHLHRADVRGLPQARGLLRGEDARPLLHLVDHRDRQQPHERATRRHALPRLHPRRAYLPRGRLPLSRGQGLVGGRQGHLRLRATTWPASSTLVFDREEGHHGSVARGHGRQLGGPRGRPPDVRERCPSTATTTTTPTTGTSARRTTPRQILLSRPDPITGAKPMLFKGAAAGHVTQGKAVGAMPNGRYAGTPIYDGGTSAMAGRRRQRSRPRSSCRPPSTRLAYECAGVAHNMKFSKAVLNSPEKLAKMASLIKTFNKRGGWHIQFNIHSAEELMEARKEPAAHKDLLVRVGGYSAYFVDLPPELQDEIVERTMHEVG